ncbi:hypothetical protein ACJJTC_012804 [Scirpophaga incertulas]
MESRQRATPQQFAVLVEFMERHGDLTKPQAGAQGRIRSEQMWERISTLLNSIGCGVNKTAEKWRKVWIDWKAKTKKKALVIQRDLRGTGGGPGSKTSLTDLEQRVLTIMGGPTAVEGLSEVGEIGFQVASTSQPITMIENIVLPSTSQDATATEEVMYNGVVVPSPTTITSREPPVTPITPPPPPQSTPQPTPSASLPEQENTALLQGETRTAPLIQRTRRTRTPFERAVDEFAAVERRRLEMEAARERRQHELDLRRLELEAQRDRTINRLADALVNFTEVPGPSPVPLKSLRIAKAFFFVLAFQSMNSEPQQATESKRLKTFIYKLY